MTRGRRAALFALCAALALAVALTAYGLGLLRGLEGRTIDQRFALRGVQPPPADLVVVAIDDRTFDELNLQWPFPRSVHGRVIDRLRQAGVRAIAYDVQFTEPTERAQDNALITAVERAAKVVLATTEVGEQGESNVFGGDEVLRQIGARAGNSSIVPDPGGVTRRMPYAIAGLENFAIVAAEAASGRRIAPSALGGPSAPIDYRGPPGTIDSVSFSDVLRGRADSRRLRGRIAVVGSTVSSLQDLHPTPMGGRELMSGPEVVANSVHTALRGFPLRDAPGWLNVLLVVLLGVATPLASLRVRPLLALGLALGLGLVFALVAQLAFNVGWIVAVTYPLLALAVGSVLSLTAHYLLEVVERQRVRGLFARFVPEQVVDDVLACADDDLRLGGREVTGTVLFADLRGFTTYSETHDPRTVIEALNVYLEAMTEAIMEAGGTLVTYLGDGVLAVFGAPISQDDHADRALRAAREMTGPRLEEFNAWLRECRLGEGFRMGVGIHSGSFMSGNVGSERRLDYTVIGDTINTASRIEGMTKGTEFMVFVSDDARERLTEEAPDLTWVDELEVRGRKGRVKIWGLRDGRADPAAGPPDTTSRASFDRPDRVGA